MVIPEVQPAGRGADCCPVGTQQTNILTWDERLLPVAPVLVGEVYGELRPGPSPNVGRHPPGKGRPAPDRVRGPGRDLPALPFPARPRRQEPNGRAVRETAGAAGHRHPAADEGPGAPLQRHL